MYVSSALTIELKFWLDANLTSKFGPRFGSAKNWFGQPGGLQIKKKTVLREQGWLGVENVEQEIDLPNRQKRGGPDGFRPQAVLPKLVFH